MLAVTIDFVLLDKGSEWLFCADVVVTGWLGSFLFFGVFFLVISRFISFALICLCKN